MIDSLKSINKEDFDPLSLVSPIDEHTKDISNLGARLKVLEDKFGSHTQIANTLLETSNEAVKMSEMLEVNFLKLLVKNEPVRLAIKQLIKAEDRNFIAVQLKRWQMWAGAAFLFLIAQISSETVKLIYHLYFQSH